MERPFKRPRLSVWDDGSLASPYVDPYEIPDDSDDDHRAPNKDVESEAEEVDEEEEEEDPDQELEQRRAGLDRRLKSTFESIFEKYSKDFTGIGDEIDLETGEIVVDNGHLKSMQDEQDLGDGRDDYREVSPVDEPEEVEAPYRGRELLRALTVPPEERPSTDPEDAEEEEGGGDGQNQYIGDIHEPLYRDPRPKQQDPMSDGESMEDDFDYGSIDPALLRSSQSKDHNHRPNRSVQATSRLATQPLPNGIRRSIETDEPDPFMDSVPQRDSRPLSELERYSSRHRSNEDRVVDPAWKTPGPEILTPGKRPILKSILLRENHPHPPVSQPSSATTQAPQRKRRRRPVDPREAFFRREKTRRGRPKRSVKPAYDVSDLNKNLLSRSDVPARTMSETGTGRSYMEPAPRIPLKDKSNPYYGRPQLNDAAKTNSFFSEGSPSRPQVPSQAQSDTGKAAKKVPHKPFTEEDDRILLRCVVEFSQRDGPRKSESSFWQEMATNYPFRPAGSWSSRYKRLTADDATQELQVRLIEVLGYLLKKGITLDFSRREEEEALMANNLGGNRPGIVLDQSPVTNSLAAEITNIESARNIDVRKLKFVMSRLTRGDIDPIPLAESQRSTHQTSHQILSNNLFFADSSKPSQPRTEPITQAAEEQRALQIAPPARKNKQPSLQKDLLTAYPAISQTAVLLVVNFNGEDHQIPGAPCPHVDCAARSSSYYRLKKLPEEEDTEMVVHFWAAKHWCPYACEVSDCNRVGAQGFFTVPSLIRHVKRSHPTDALYYERMLARFGEEAVTQYWGVPPEQRALGTTNHGFPEHQQSPDPFVDIDDIVEETETTTIETSVQVQKKVSVRRGAKTYGRRPETFMNRSPDMFKNRDDVPRASSVAEKPVDQASGSPQNKQLPVPANSRDESVIPNPQSSLDTLPQGNSVRPKLRLARPTHGNSKQLERFRNAVPSGYDFSDEDEAPVSQPVKSLPPATESTKLEDTRAPSMESGSTLVNPGMSAGEPLEKPILLPENSEPREPSRPPSSQIPEQPKSPSEDLVPREPSWPPSRRSFPSSPLSSLFSADFADMDHMEVPTEATSDSFPTEESRASSSSLEAPSPAQPTPPPRQHSVISYAEPPLPTGDNMSDSPSASPSLPNWRDEGDESNESEYAPSVRSRESSVASTSSRAQMPPPPPPAVMQKPAQEVVDLTEPETAAPENPNGALDELDSQELDDIVLIPSTKSRPSSRPVSRNTSDSASTSVSFYSEHPSSSSANMSFFATPARSGQVAETPDARPASTENEEAVATPANPLGSRNPTPTPRRRLTPFVPLSQLVKQAKEARKEAKKEAKKAKRKRGASAAHGMSNVAVYSGSKIQFQVSPKASIKVAEGRVEGKVCGVAGWKCEGRFCFRCA